MKRSPRSRAIVDPLTGLATRPRLIERLGRARGSSARTQNYAALLIVNLDAFSHVNASRGQDEGDAVLVETARRIESSIRDEDLLVRSSGDEFIVLVELLDENERLAAEKVRSLASRIAASLDEPVRIGERAFLVTASIGISTFLGAGATVDDILSHATGALHRAKAAGAGSIRFHDPTIQAALDERAALTIDLRQALREHQFVLHYQPVVDVAGMPVGVEVLLRWQHPERGLVPPVQFIGLAEEAGLIVDIGLWVLETACDTLRDWSTDPLLGRLEISVNVSARQFEEPGFVEDVRAMLRAHKVRPGNLRLELTESMLFTALAAPVEKTRRLREIGVGLSLDDFGTGYSSLASLRSLAIDTLKVDRSFVRDITTDPSSEAIVQTIVDIARNLGLSVVAEGVETPAQQDLLHQQGCRLFQGYMHARPAPRGEIEAWLRNSLSRRSGTVGLRPDAMPMSPRSAGSSGPDGTQGLPPESLEARRLRALDDYALSDGIIDRVFESVSKLAATVGEATEAGLAIVASEHVQIVAAAGFRKGARIPRAGSLVARVVEADVDFYEVHDVLGDTRFDPAAPPVELARGNARRFTGIPVLSSEGYRIGALFVVGREPGALSPTQRASLAELARTLSSLLEARRTNRQNADRLKAIYADSPALLYLLDGDGRLVTASRQWLDKFGYEMDEVRGMRALDMITGESRDAFLATREAFWANGGCLEFPCQWRTRAGEVLDVLMSATIDYDDEGRALRALCVLTDVTERIRVQRELEKASRTDPLTGAMNRAGFSEALRLEIKRAERHRRPLSVVMIDVDHFKAVNDTWGHAVGDDVLVAMVAGLQAQLRENDQVGRLGGEEFTLLLPETPLAGAIRVAERFRSSLERASLSDRRPELRCTVSAGVATFRAGDDGACLLERADRALYSAKGAGRDCTWFTADLDGEPTAADSPIREPETDAAQV
ncbi:MAG: diguanylate cyclase [Burkholderiaceae bacterium]|nr:diguanylate cyclase [Burkholderiaceae bacterium]